MYNNVISLGYFCGPSIELEKRHYRRVSYPFDWLITDLDSVLWLIDNQFEHFLNYEDLYQYSDNPDYYINKKLNIHFYHDFNRYAPLGKQYEAVREKYERRIQRFYKMIEEPTCFLRHMRDQKEYDYVCKHYEEIMKVLHKYNPENCLILLGNEDIVKKDVEFLNTYQELFAVLGSIVDVRKYKQDKKYTIKKVLRRIGRKGIRLLKSNQQSYKHNKIFDVSQKKYLEEGTTCME